ncbi:DUF3784 domain-containing protein [Anaerosporobacter sp.]
MAIIFFILGLLFYKSKEKASNFLTGYNQKGDEEPKKIKHRIGCTLAWIVWIGLFIWHMFDRVKRENTKMQ